MTTTSNDWKTDAVVVMNDDGHDTYPDVADAAEITANRTQLVFLDGSSEMVDGHIFGTQKGTWKMWADTGRGIMHAEPVEAPILTLPNKGGDLIRFEYDGMEQRRGGRIKRLKRADL